jgi:hypothetical protein
VFAKERLRQCARHAVTLALTLTPALPVPAGPEPRAVAHFKAGAVRDIFGRGQRRAPTYTGTSPAPAKARGSVRFPLSRSSRGY